MSTETKSPEPHDEKQTGFCFPPRIALGMAIAFLALTIVTLLLTIVTWTRFIITAPEGPLQKAPEWTGDKNDFQKLTFYESTERQRQRLQAERQTTVTHGCAHLVGIALVFVALTLFSYTLGSAGVHSEQWPLTLRNVAITLAGMVALACATVVFVYWSPQPVSVVPATQSFVPQSFVPQSFAPQ